jgi:ATP-dependent helicase HrpA
VLYRPISEMNIGGSDDDEFDDFEENLLVLLYKR